MLGKITKTFVILICVLNEFNSVGFDIAVYLVLSSVYGADDFLCFH